MSLSRQILLVKTLVIGALLLTVAATSFSNSALTTAAIVGVLVIPRVPGWMCQSRWKRRSAALRAGDFPRVRQLSDELREVAPGNAALVDALAFDSAYMLMEEERFAEALLVLTALLRPVQKPEAVDRVMTLNSLAWCNAFLGECSTAEAQAVEAVELARQHLHPSLSYCLGTLGTVLVVAKREALAVPVLESALAVGGPEQRALAIRTYFLGEALMALGREPEATAAWERTLREAPASKWAQRARAKLGRAG